MAMHTHSSIPFGTRKREAQVPARTPMDMLPIDMGPLDKVSVDLPDGAQISEQRASLRHRVLKGANINFNRGYGAYSCTVKNLSEGGAMVAMEDSSGLPSEFDFVIKGEKLSRRASISWRAKGRAGVRFL